ncbi:hypothetical protein A2713_02560 [candidate division WWE3 bacterium RIFCSPHIGHO2_01_FULL_35_17]|uniref:Uncharacterized protein n=1 Tax=candidate division WWE3 bacterium RIFCSPHIGHO2_01_FULL_35_17 TaxID=1802614 RepID=A0A1F4US65_UNCKA|nr:MAG: hypothetical protein A2713_02560 [candidate division WWE3 bacterium RIFCSPHIGHO2_01_FULL_35_17]
MQNTSKAQVIRPALKIGLHDSHKQNVASVKALFQIAELGRKNNVKGPKDGVENFDKYLYKKNGFKLASEL